MTNHQNTSVYSGVPPGSVNGPTQFHCYINDTPQQIKNELKLFAPDAKLFTPVDSRKDGKTLQKDSNTLADWSNKWLLDFHTSKSSILHIGKHPHEFTYHIKDKTGTRYDLRQITAAKDLSVLLDEKLNFLKHNNNIICDANTC